MEKRYFIYLVSCFLNQSVPKGELVDWKVIYHLSDINDITAIVYQQIISLDDEFKPKGELLSHFKQNLGFTIQSYNKKMAAQQSVKFLLDSSKIDHVFVKGAAIRKYYPVEELRTSGDIDVIVKKNDFDTIYNLLKEKNIKILRHESETISAVVSSCEVEIHKTADVKSSYFDNIFLLCKMQSGCTYELPEYEHLLYVMCHLIKHLSYRGAGIRMLMDIDVLVRGIKDFDCEKFISMCRLADIEKSAKTILSLCNFWFHTPLEAFVDFKQETKLLEIFETVLLEGGSFGYEMNAVPLAQTGSNSISTLFKLAFPSRELLKKAYPYYDKNHALLPVARLNRLYDGLTKKRRRAKESAAQAFTNNKSSGLQKALLSELGIKNQGEK